MEDRQIIDLYFQRDEAAISETAAKYGAFCYGIADRILSVREDAQECVNDAYLRAWNAIPPQRPEKFGLWLARVVRNTALDLWDKNHRKKRYAGMQQLLTELEDCIPSPVTVEHEVESRGLTEALNRWLASLAREERILFLRRYWNGEKVNALAADYGVSPKSMAKKMYMLRQKLRHELEKEGYPL